MTSPHTYVLPVAALIETMKGMRTSITLRAQLPTRSKFSKENCLAEIVIETGEMLSCVIKTEDNRKLLFSSEEAFALLQELGSLKWQLIASGRRELPTSAQEKSSRKLFSSEEAAKKINIPRKVITSLPLAQFKGLPQRHKQIFLLIDGHKDSAEIGRLLSMPQNSVEDILKELYHLQLITI